MRHDRMFDRKGECITRPIGKLRFGNAFQTGLSTIFRSATCFCRVLSISGRQAQTTLARSPRLGVTAMMWGN